MTDAQAEAGDRDRSQGPVALCAWCGTPVRGGDLESQAPAKTSDAPSHVTHGICVRCVAELDLYPIESLFDFDRERYDDLPFGIIEVDGDGRILTYNRWEEELAGRSRTETLGRNFFREVAPCTAVAAFEGRFREMVAAGRPARDTLDFVFRFPGGDRLVTIALTWAPAWKRGFILVRELAR